MQKVAIIGAGISGLSMAQLLKDRYEVKVFEKESSPGGLVRCKRINGSLFHLCGGHVFNSNYQNVLDWFWSFFRRDESFLKAERNSVVFMGTGEIIPYPIENHMYLFDKETQEGFIRDLLNLSNKESRVLDNFEAFLRNQFGDTLYELYFRPYNEKIWRRSLKNVPLSWLEGKLPMPTVEEMIFNNINHVKEKEFVHSSFWYEKEGGSQYVANRLTQDVSINYSVNVNNVSFDSKAGKWNICAEIFDKVIFCGNIKDMLLMIKGVEVSGFAKDIEELEYHGTTTVFCEIDANPYSWIYLPSKKYHCHRIICTGNFSKTNNGGDLPKHRITATIEFTDDISEENIKEELKRVPFHPEYITHVFHKYTYPIQDANTRSMILDLKQYLSVYNIYFTGRFADWEYYNMDACMAAAMKLSDCLV